MLPVLFLALFGSAQAEWDACTSIAVGRKATVEGTGLATHNNDCATCDPRVAYIPARDHAPGSRRAIAPFQLEYPRYVGADRSETYAPVDGQKDTVSLGSIDQVPHTYGYWEAAYPLLNEHGLGFGESTCGGKLVGQSKMQGGEALFSMSELMKVALERCRTARCAIQTMGDVAVEHGFYGEDPGMPGAGESLSVVDPSETWVFHITGGLNNKSATWVAQRVPDDHVAVVANNFIIQKVSCSDSANFLCSTNIFSNAREGGLCKFDAEDDFNWLNCYGTDVRSFHYNPVLPPIPYYTTLRMWRIQGLANPEMAIELTDNPFAFPFSVPVAQKVSRTDIMNWTRDYYKDTPFDMSLGIMAGEFNNPNRLEGGHGQLEVPGQFARGISIPRTNYAVIVEAKPVEKAGQSIAWFATDQPLTSVFVPFFAASDQAAAAYHSGRQEVFTRDSAWWAFNFVSNWMNINFREMMVRHVGPAMMTEQEKIMRSVRELEESWPEKRDAVNDVQQGLQEDVVKTWWTLADDLIVHFSDGLYTHKNTTKAGIGYPAWWLQMIGFDNDFFRVKWVQLAAVPPILLLPSLPESLRPHVAAAKAAATRFLEAGQNFDWEQSLKSFVPGVLVGTVLGGVMAVMMLARSTPKIEGAGRPLLAQ